MRPASSANRLHDRPSDSTDDRDRAHDLLANRLRSTGSLDTAPDAQAIETTSTRRRPITHGGRLHGGLFLLAGVFVITLAIDWPAGTKKQGQTQRPLYLDLNQASAAELRLLPTIGPQLASRIVRFREMHGEFRTWKDVQRVSGIGPATLAAIRPWAGFEPEVIDRSAVQESLAAIQLSDGADRSGRSDAGQYGDALPY